MNVCSKRKPWLAAILLNWLIPAVPAQAVSFDCAKAQTKVEELICADADLSKLDEELNAAYKFAVHNEKQTESIRQSQKQWMKERNGCEDADCLKATYQARIQKLTVMPDQVGAETQVVGSVTSEKPIFTNEIDKLKFMQRIVRQNVFKSRSFPSNSKLCEQFLKDFTAGKHVQAVEPDVIADNENDPRLSKWHDCEDAEQKAENVLEYRFLSFLGGPTYRYYHIELDGNPKNGKEDVIYTEFVKKKFDFAGKTSLELSGATGYAWVDLKDCVVKGGAGIGTADAITPLLPDMYRLSMIVKYLNRNLEVHLYPIGETYHFYTENFETGKPGSSCAWHEPYLEPKK